LATVGHRFPHVPQLFVSVASVVHVATQSTNGATQLGAQKYVPLDTTHSGVAPEHTVAHEPQLAGTVSVASQPSAAEPLQFA